MEPFVLTGHGEEVTHCSICGLVLDEDEDQPAPDAADAALETVLVAEDTQAVLDAVSQMLERDRVAREVVPASNGVEFVSEATARLRDGRAVSLAILDVEMPVMNGVQAAMSLRKLEGQVGKKRKTPVLFFTSRKCDERLKEVLKKVQPSSYVNKGASTNPADLAKRVNKVLGMLLQGKATA